jgi:hypothetical protein
MHDIHSEVKNMLEGAQTIQRRYSQVLTVSTTACAVIRYRYPHPASNSMKEE